MSKRILMSDVRKVIEENLPGQVGNVLKERLDQAETDAENLEALKNRVKTMQDQIDALTKKADILKKLKLKKEELDEKEASLNLLQQVLEEKKKYMEERIADMKDIVKTVFQNNRFKYDVTKDIVTPLRSGDYADQRTGTEHVEGEK